MQYLVTGGAGFIGSHLCDALLASGHSVIVLDDLSSGTRENVPNGATLTIGDAACLDTVIPLITQVDGVFHLAAIASVDKSRTAWRHTTHANLMATVAVLDAISRRDTPIPCVYASSAAIYGDSAACPINEISTPNPQTAYGADKYASEVHARIGSHIHDIPSTGLRFFNIYGPRQDPHSPYSGVISIFARAMLDGTPVNIHGDGAQSRDFVYVADVVTMLHRVMQHHHDNQRSKADVSNICSGVETSVKKLAGTLASLTNYERAIVHTPARAGDIARSLGDPTHGQSTYGYTPATSLSDGLRSTLEWMSTATPS